jgi:hypothetical protein
VGKAVENLIPPVQHSLLDRKDKEVKFSRYHLQLIGTLRIFTAIFIGVFGSEAFERFNTIQALC